MKAKMFFEGAALYLGLLVLIFALVVSPEHGTEPRIAALTMTLFIAWAMVNAGCRLYGTPVAWFVSLILNGGGILFLTKKGLQYAPKFSWLDAKSVSLGNHAGYIVEDGTLTSAIILTISILLIWSMSYAVDLIGKSWGLTSSRISRLATDVTIITLACLADRPLGIINSVPRLSAPSALQIVSSTKQSPDYSLPPGIGPKDLAEFLLPGEPAKGKKTEPARTPIGKDAKIDLLADCQHEDNSLPKQAAGQAWPDPSLFPTK